MAVRYGASLRDAPLAIELYNTVYAVGGSAVDGLTDQASAEEWLERLAQRLPRADVPAGTWPAVGELVKPRGAVRAALQAAIEGHPQDPAVLEIVNGFSARAPRSPLARRRTDGHAEAATDLHGASRADVVIGAFAQSAIELLTGPRRDDVRACGAPGCILIFVKDHPRREWCSNSCGNRARQARHYHRTRRHTGDQR